MRTNLKLYRGKSNSNEQPLDGSCFQNPPQKKDYDFLSKNLRNARSVISMFRIKTRKRRRVPSS
jgi:hypothetical protein